MSEEFITNALKALRRADAHVETGPETEIRTLLAFRRQERRRRARRTAGWCTVAAAVVASASLWPLRQAPKSADVVVSPPKVEALAIPMPTPTPPPLVKHATPKPAKPREIVTGFYPLMESPPPFERGLLVRMTVPASAMRTVGLTVGDDHLSDPVQADVLVGQDDLARAIRFVSYQK